MVASKRGRLRRKSNSVEETVRIFNLELSYSDSIIHHFWKPKNSDVIVVGYIVHDDNCDSPLTYTEGSGKIESNGHWKHHIGRDSYGCPQYDEQIEFVRRLRGVHPDDDTTQDIIEVAESLWQELWARGKIGTPYAVPLKEKYHGGYEEVENSENARIDAVWIPDNAALEHINSYPESERRIRAKELFEAVIDEYNKWAEGDCYGAVVDIFIRRGDDYELDNSEACWGYIGNDHAEQELKFEFEAIKKWINTKEKTCNSKPHRQSSAPSQTA